MIDSRTLPTPLVIDLPHEDHKGVDTFSCALILKPASFDDLLDAFWKIKTAQRTRGRAFLTLDDPDQCLYTSGHARGKHDLDAGLDYPEHDDAKAVRDYEVALLQAARAAVRDPNRSLAWEQVCGSLLTFEADIDALAELNRAPARVLGNVHAVQCLPVQDGVDLLANLPNGYFEGDWSPFVCHAVALRLRERHGYELFGIGARMLGFMRLGNADPLATQALIDDLRALYGHPDAHAWADLAATLEASPCLLLGYTEDFAELIETSGSSPDASADE
jgi:hypothetical protein